MSDYLDHLVARTLWPMHSIRPRARSEFEPSPPAGAGLLPADAETPLPPPDSAPGEALDPRPPHRVATSPVVIPAPPSSPPQPATLPFAPVTAVPKDASATISAPPAEPIARRLGVAHGADVERTSGEPPRSSPGRRAQRVRRPSAVPEEMPAAIRVASEVLGAGAVGETQPERRSTLTRERVPLGERDVTPRAPMERTPSHRAGDARVASEPPARRVAVPALRPAPLEPTARQRSDVSPRPALPRRRAAETEPTIRVTIGRVEVRAVTPPSRPPSKPAELRRPPLSLDEYLERRNAGRL